MVRLHHLIGGAATITAFILNGLLLGIIVKCSSDNIGVYKYFLFAYTLNAVYYCSAEFLLLTNFYIPEVADSSSAAFICLSTLSIVPKSVQTWVLTSFVGSYDINLLIVCWSFLYRLSIVSESDIFKSKRKVFALFVVSFCIWILMTYNIVVIHPTPEADEHFAETVITVTGYNVSDIGYIGAPFFWKDDSFNWTISICLLAHGSYYTSVNIFVVFCWVKIRRGLNAMQSRAGHHFHRKIYILLTLQTVFPIVFMSTPVVLDFVFSICKWYVGDYMLIAGAVLSFAQVIDPICIMYLINDYKNVIKKAFCIKIAQINSAFQSSVHISG